MFVIPGQDQGPYTRNKHKTYKKLPAHTAPSILYSHISYMKMQFVDIWKAHIIAEFAFEAHVRIVRHRHVIALKLCSGEREYIFRITGVGIWNAE